MLILFVNVTVSRVFVFECIHYFKEFKMCVKNEEHPGSHYLVEMS